MVAGDVSGQRAQMFPLSAEQADRVLASVMASDFPDGVISRVEFPNKGYTTTIRVLFDSHQITAVMVASKGQEGTKLVDGYYFQVNDAGTLLISGKARARRVFQRLVQEASMISHALPFAR